MMIKPIRLLGEKACAIRHRYFDKFVFIHINKTGGSSIKEVLNLPFEHVTALEKIASLGRQQWDRRFTFTVIRNPWDKVVSHYHFRLQKKRIVGIEFKDWVKKTYRDQIAPFYDVPKMFMPQTDWICDRDGNILCDCICRFENLTNDFGEVCMRLGKTAFLPHLKSSKHRPYQEYYDSETVDIIAQCFSKDVERFGYRFEGESH